MPKRTTTSTFPRPTGELAIVGGRVVPVVGDPIEGGTVLIRDGVIAEIGPKVKISKEARVIDATGQWVLPGFVEAHGHVGVHEEGNGWAGQEPSR